MKVAILTEGGQDIGFGHTTRCLSLSQIFKANGISVEFIVNGDRQIHNYLGENNHEIFDWLKNKKQLFSLIRAKDIVIVDSYLAGFDIYNFISESVKVPVYIDDNCRLSYPRGLVINGSINAQELGYDRSGDVKYLLGTKYIPLRREFWEARDKKIRNKPEAIMITFGGQDLRRLTPLVLDFMVRKFPAMVKNVIIGIGFQNKSEIYKLKDSQTNIVCSPDAAKMKKVMLDSDLAISSGGQTLYELARIGVPTIGIAVADNQLWNLKGWQKAGFIRHIGWYNDSKILEKLNRSLKLIISQKERRRSSRIGRSYVDGKGAKRIFREIYRYN